MYSVPWLQFKFTFLENTWKPKIKYLTMFMFGLLKTLDFSQKKKKIHHSFTYKQKIETDLIITY